MPGRRAARRDVVAIDAGIEHELARGDARASSTIVRRRLRGIGSSVRIDRRERRRRRPHVAQRVAVDRQRRTRGDDDAPGDRAGARHGDLLADRRLDGGLERIDAARHAAPGHLAHPRREHRIGTERVVDGDRIGIEVEQPADPSHGGRQVAPVRQTQRGAHDGPPVATLAGTHGDRAVPAGQVEGTVVRAPSQCSTPGTARAARNASTSSAANGSRTGSSSSTAPVVVGGPRAAPGAQHGRRRREHHAHGVVELADAAEASGVGDVDERHVRRLEQRAGGVGALGAGDRERAGAELVGHHAVRWRSL